MSFAVQFAFPLAEVGDLPAPVPVTRRTYSLPAAVQEAYSLESAVAVYCDGGVAGPNPSAVGGSWAWCAVDARGRRVVERSGVLLPNAGVPELATITNNHTELWAALMALEALPEGWQGMLYSDSGITICRLKNRNPSMVNIPAEWVTRVKGVKSRLGKIGWLLLGGHPTKADLLAGKRARDGKPVSEHNVWCDKACKHEAKRLLKGRK